MDDRRRGSFDLIGIIDCICGSWATSDPQHVQPRLQEQGTDTTENNDDIDRVDILYGANRRPHQAQVRSEEQEQEVQEDGGPAQGGGGQQVDDAEHDDEQNGDNNSRTIARCGHDIDGSSYTIGRCS